jgi:hypothetical protein
VKLIPVVLLTCATASALGAQLPDAARAGVVRRIDADTVATDTARVSWVTRLRRPAHPFAPLASLLVPGAGQWMQGDDRALAYAAVEVISWWKYANDRREQRGQEAEFKELARTVARSRFSSILPDGDWSYYEAMRDFTDSGNFSLTSSGPVVPETDTTTFNGKVWLIAQSTHPDFASALAQYEQRAAKPDFLWSWRNAQLQYNVFKRTTNKRNDANHAAIADARLVVLNHLISMVDAFTTFRLRVQAEADGRTTVQGSLHW